MSRALAGAGCEVVLAATSPFERLDGFEDVCIRPIAERVSSAPSRVKLLGRRLRSQADRAGALRRIVRAFVPDIVHVDSNIGKFDFLYFRYLRSLGTRVVCTVHEPKPDSGVDWFDRARWRAADHLLVHSEVSMAALLEGGVERSKITRIFHATYLDICPVSSVSQEEARISLGLPPDARVVLFFGAIRPNKGLDLLIQAFGRIGAADYNAYLVIAGEPQEDFAKYQRQIEGLGLRSRTLLSLRYIPFTDFPMYFRAASTVVFPYRRVQQSGVLQIAYAYGRPVVATDVGGLREAVETDRTGVVVRADNVDALAGALRWMLSNASVAEDMGKRGRRLAETKYSWTKTAEEIGRVYRALGTSPRAAAQNSL
jgi:glycosyltransferase involved in cell wall biosynthesis